MSEYIEDAISTSRANAAELQRQRRERMPLTAEALAHFTEIFGPGVRIVWAIEGNERYGRPDA